MGRKLRRFIGELKDKASLTVAALSPPPSPSTAVLRATSRSRPSSPPRPRDIAALLSFGSGARPAAAALAASLSSRLLSTSDPSVALKSLLSLHRLLRAAPFILLDSLLSSLRPNPSGRFTRSPLLLSSFPLGPNPHSWALSTIVRWYSGLLELRLKLPDPSSSSDLSDWVSCLLTRDLISELDAMVKFFAVAVSPPEMIAGNRLVEEVRRVVEEDRVTAEEGIRVRVGEVKVRIGEIGFGDAVELGFVLGKMEGYGPSDVREVRGLVAEIASRGDKEARVVRRERAGFLSDRLAVRTGEPVLFGSNRWPVQH